MSGSNFVFFLLFGVKDLSRMAELMVEKISIALSISVSEFAGGFIFTGRLDRMSMYLFQLIIWFGFGGKKAIGEQ